MKLNYSKLIMLGIVNLLLISLISTSPVIGQTEVTPSVTVSDQPIVANSVTVDSITANATSWIVIHEDNAGAPGPILGYTNVSEGTTTNVVVAIANTTATTLYAMLHYDLGTVGTFEFPGTDGPVTVDGAVVTPPFTVTSTIAAQSVTVTNQAVVANTVTIDSVVSAGPGWLVIHADNGGAPGTVLGYSNVSHGTNEYITVTLDTAGQTSTMYAMLHWDNGTDGTYEFPGADGPVKVDGAVVTPPFTVSETITAQSVTVADQQVENDKVVVAEVVSAGPGWIVIHADNDGAPGTVLGQTAVSHGKSTDVEVTLATDGRTEVLYAMLHFDNGEVGTYEFPGVDGPVSVDGSVVTPSFSTAAPTDDTTSETSDTTSDTTSEEESPLSSVAVFSAMIGVAVVARSRKQQ